ncbi:immunoglobulin superfamily member 23 isoform X3 [Camelus bactrianus]|uniref:immunoglobulin superfamily member 23 isoform X3 n=1 Tax=Camelus bactrianus TaxID=9837 RepID=UPI003D6EBE55
MRCPLGAGSGHSPAWKRLLLTGTLLAFLELPSSASLAPLTEGADAHLPVRGSLDGVLSTSWFRGHEARTEAMIFSPEGLPGPGHTGRETLDTQGSLVIRNVTTQDAGSYTMVLETSKGRRSVTEQIQVKANLDGVLLLTFPGNTNGVIYSDLNYSVILQWVASVNPEPVLRWSFNGKPRGTGEKLIIQRSQCGSHRPRACPAGPHSLPVRRICHRPHRGCICGDRVTDRKHSFHLNPEVKVRKRRQENHTGCIEPPAVSW